MCGEVVAPLEVSWCGGAPTERRQGIAALLIESVATWATELGAGVLVLGVVASNAPAIALYERAGFMRADREGTGDGAPNEIRLVRSLSTRGAA